MTPDPIDTFLDGAFTRLFADISRPEPLMCRYCGGSGDVHSMDGEWRGICTECNAFASLHPDPVDADEAVNGVCAQGEEHDQ